MNDPSQQGLAHQASYASLAPAKGGDAPLLGSRPGTPASLSQHYMPQKFAPLSNIRKRGAKPSDYMQLPKRGGGREAFAAGEGRMPDAQDEDYDGVQSGWFGKEGGRSKPSLKWNHFKWILILSNTIVRRIALPHPRRRS
jgi:hypothetical protein